MQTVVLAGLATDTGVESTARTAFEHGCAVVIAGGATSSVDTGVHEFAVARVLPLIAQVTTTAAALAAHLLGRRRRVGDP